MAILQTFFMKYIFTCNIHVEINFYDLGILLGSLYFWLEIYRSTPDLFVILVSNVVDLLPPLIGM
jgi:hypothetical protein